MKDEKIIQSVPIAPRGLAILAFVGPAFVWTAEYIGSGEVIIATRAGAIFGSTILWAVVTGILLKSFIGIGGARYTVCTGEGMIDMFARMPGRGNVPVWIVLVVQIFAGSLAIGSVASAAGVFVNSLVPLKPYIWGWIISLFAFVTVWSGEFRIMKLIMSFLVSIVILGVMYVAAHTFPGLTDILKGIFGFSVPEIPGWAHGMDGVAGNAWGEILPLIGWAAGGFASQVWYTYWVLGSGYGMAHGRRYGQSCDLGTLKSMTAQTAHEVKQWCRVLMVDGTVAALIGIVATSCFLLSGAGVLRPQHLAPNGPELALELSTIFSRIWGGYGGMVFIIVGAAALICTQIGQLAGWPRLMADAFRICVPRFAAVLPWKVQFRIFLSFFMVASMIIIYSLGFKPVTIIKISAVVDGLLLTPLQAVMVLVGLGWVLPRLLSSEAKPILRTNWILYAGLICAAVVFSYFCVFMLFAA